MKFIFHGNPKAQIRPRAFRIGKGIRFYDPSSVEKTKIAWEARAQMLQNCFKPIKNGPIEARVTIFTHIPLSLKKRALKQENESIFCFKRPDIDNYIKLIFDSLNKIAYHDDGQISELNARKIYSSNPRVEIELNSLEDQEL